ncbi:MAG: lipopolysaccharide biosynthesis protein [bacterium]|nr:lipopolysaccharide biosynthesis protein [bacterium]
MKISKFIKDLFVTGFSQGVVLILGLLLVKIMGIVLDKEHFGLFVVFRRTIGVMLPLVTLSLGLSLAKFVSFDKEKQDHYLKLTLGIVNIVLLILLAAAFLLDTTASRLLFGTPGYPMLAKVFFLFLYAGALYLVVYSFYRGKQEMVRANILNMIYFSFPLLLGVGLLVLRPGSYYRTLIYYFGLYAIPVMAVCIIYYLKKRVFTFRYPFKFTLKESGAFLLYGLTRMPASLALSAIFAFPALFAGRYMTLEIAGLIGLAVMVIRMLEIFAAPFNKIFLPKFSEFKGMGKDEDIREKSLMVVDFIITFLPVVVLLLVGLSKHIVLFWMGVKFIDAVPAVETAMLFSAFYVAYALIRGILNGVFVFPYVNIICLLGAAAVSLPTIIYFRRDLMDLAVSFGFGVLTLGVSSMVILVKKLKLKFPLKTFLIYTAIAAAVFFIAHAADKFLLGLTGGNIYLEFAVLVLYRGVIVLAIFFLLWKRTMWYSELRKRMNLRTGAGNKKEEG